MQVSTGEQVKHAAALAGSSLLVSSACCGPGWAAGTGEVNILQAGTGSCWQPGQRTETIAGFLSACVGRIISMNGARNELCHATGPSTFTAPSFFPSSFYLLSYSPSLLPSFLFSFVSSNCVFDPPPLSFQSGSSVSPSNTMSHPSTWFCHALAISTRLWHPFGHCPMSLGQPQQVPPLKSV